MQSVQISDDVAFLLRELTEREHISSANLIAQLVKSHKDEITKRDELKEFFEPYRKDLSGFAFNREEANER
uniref:RHH-type transcriptional regulator, rel operon repressor / antitoxin RelB n=1 Tax=Candidatus Kentrum sp. FM TaxID=2126340 RepID=A0A450TH97_9GAMM|nr:MAG: hypothetical protein BECKFM1743C_GA0114222_104277 [Candidatus Kentron sp. FM]VFJ68373.1 MAG: hypothetical protein BECKFM1743A_GA0114220_104718 [Candidatus Kentron sp. FM]VFK17225.1 MAG: hypothetical protein BECKFM1743B_GA0114221_104677 [Candidatus Kentron sp. FM]